MLSLSREVTEFLLLFKLLLYRLLCLCFSALLVQKYLIADLLLLFLFLQALLLLKPLLPFSNLIKSLSLFSLGCFLSQTFKFIIVELDFVKERIVLDVHFLIFGVSSVYFIDTDFSDSPFGAHIVSFGLHSAQTAAQRVHTLEWVFRGRWVRHSKWAINTATVINLTSTEVIMVILTVVSVIAAEQGLTAAEHALPSDVLVSMLWAVELATANLLDCASTAEQIFLFCVLCELQVALTVGQSTEVGLRALAALIEGSLSVQIFVFLAKPLAFWVFNWPGIDLTLLEGFLSKHFNFLFKLKQWLDVLVQLWVVGQFFEWLLAGRARHEIEAYSQCAPFVLEQVSYTLGVVHVIARQLDARVRSKLACETDVAKVILALLVFLALDALWLEAGQAFCLVVDSTAGMAAMSVNSLAWVKL